MSHGHVFKLSANYVAYIVSAIECIIGIVIRHRSNFKVLFILCICGWVREDTGRCMSINNFTLDIRWPPCFLWTHYNGLHYVNFWKQLTRHWVTWMVTLSCIAVNSPSAQQLNWNYKTAVDLTGWSWMSFANWTVNIA